MPTGHTGESKELRINMRVDAERKAVIALPHQAFLRYGCHQDTVAGIDRAPAKAARARGRRAVARHTALCGTWTIVP